MESLSQNNPSSCCCATSSKPKSISKFEVIKSSSLAVFIAFFPKCPLCWAAYMSLFSSIGITQLPYMPWLLPILIIALVVHLLFLFRKIKEKGYFPILISVFGAFCIVFSRYYPLEDPTISYLGLAAMIAGSILNNSSKINFKIQKN